MSDCSSYSESTLRVQYNYEFDSHTTTNNLITRNYAYITTEADAGLLIVDLSDMTGNTYWHVTGFMYSCLQYAYNRQLAFYMNAVIAEYPDYGVEAFIIAIDTKGSYDVAVYQLPSEWIEKGNEDIESLLTEYKHYKESNNFNYCHCFRFTSWSKSKLETKVSHIGTIKK